MIIEDYVSFETAKLLKEKGFDEPCHALYHNGEDKIFFGLDVDSYYNTVLNADCYTCPTIQMAMKWLRREHNLAISTSVTVDGWHSYVSRIKLDSEGFVVNIIDGIDDGNIPNCDTYEESCEAAIKYCLKFLI